MRDNISPKFKAWHTELKKMFSAEEMGEDDLTLTTNGRGFINVSGMSTKLSTLAGDKMIPLMYSGKFDINGVEICDSDILVRDKDGDNPKFYLIVHYEYGIFYGVTVPGNKYNLTIREWEHCDSDGGGYNKVIGNTFENPEIMNKF